MKRQDYIAVLETHEEVFDVFFMPAHWDYRAGGTQCGFCAAYHYLHLPEEESRKFSIGFANDNLETYWNLLYKTREYAFFDFKDGAEEVDGLPLRYAEDVYLKAAKYIANTGVDNFSVSRVIGDSYTAIRFTNTKGKSFLFKDIIDVNLFLSAKDVYENRQAGAKSQTILEEFEAFIK